MNKYLSLLSPTIPLNVPLNQLAKNLETHLGYLLSRFTSHKDLEVQKTHYTADGITSTFKFLGDGKTYKITMIEVRNPAPTGGDAA